VAPDFRQPHHLPKRRGDAPGPPPDLPRQRRGTTPQMRGRYPDHDVLARADHWDEATRRLVLDRAENPPSIRFFDAREASTLAAFCDTVTAQDEEPRIPVLAYVDDKMHNGKLDGYQHAGMPDDREVWRRVARGLDDAAGERGTDSFAALPADVRREIVGAFADGKLSGGVWDDMPPVKAWSVVMRAVLGAFYSHPWAWNEIGFGGPAYPQGYARMGVGQSEGWEGEEAFEVDPVSDVPERGVE